MDDAMPTGTPLHRPLLALVVFLSSVAVADPGVDLGGHRHVDLSAATPSAPPAGAKELPVSDALPAPKAACGDEPPGRLSWLGDDADRTRRGEGERMAATAGKVGRQGDTLTLAPAHGKPLRFTDVVVAATASTDGDATRFLFAGTLAGTRFWRVESSYQHDSPGSWLIDPDRGDAFFAHNGAGGTVLSADGRWMAVAELLNAPWQITLTELAATPAAVRVDCRIVDADVHGAFAACGFDADGGFRLSWRDGTDAVAALRLARRTDGRWQLEHSAGAPPLRCVTP